MCWNSLCSGSLDIPGPALARPGRRRSAWALPPTGRRYPHSFVPPIGSNLAPASPKPIAKGIAAIATFTAASPHRRRRMRHEQVSCGCLGSRRHADRQRGPAPAGADRNRAPPSESTSPTCRPTPFAAFTHSTSGRRCARGSRPELSGRHGSPRTSAIMSRAPMNSRRVLARWTSFARSRRGASRKPACRTPDVRSSTPIWTGSEFARRLRFRSVWKTFQRASPIRSRFSKPRAALRCRPTRSSRSRIA